MLTQAGFPSSLKILSYSSDVLAKSQGKCVGLLLYSLDSTMCESQGYLDSVLMRFMDDLLALDSIVRFDLVIGGRS